MVDKNRNEKKEIEILRRRVKELEKKEALHELTEARLKKASEMATLAEISADMGSWRWDLKANKIEWSDFSESIPCFLMITGIPLSYSIADGLAMGFISYPVIKLLSGRGKQVTLLMYILAVLLIAYFIFVRSKI